MLELRINGALLPEGEEAHSEAVELEEWEPVEIAVSPVPRAIDARFSLDNNDLGQPTTTPFDPTWRWRWQPGGVAGSLPAELVVTLPDGTLLRRRFELRLRPRAIDRRMYHELLAAIAGEGRSLALRLGGPSLEHAALVPVDPHSRTALEEATVLLQRHGRLLADCLRLLGSRPATTLRGVRRRQPLSDVRAPESLDLRELTRGPFDPTPVAVAEGELLRALRAATGGPLPPEVTAGQTLHSQDIPEHRFAAWLAAELARRARLIRGMAEQALELHHEEQAAHRRLRTLLTRSDRLARQIDALRSQPPLVGLPPRPRPPQGPLLHRDRRYRPLRHIWRELRSAPLLALDVPLLLLPIADLPTLYEGWTVISTCAALAELGQVRSQQILDPYGDGWTLRLQRDTPLLEVAIGARLIRVRYQPRYEPNAGLDASLGSLDRYLRIPDLGLEVLDGDERWLVILDAKYRLAPDGHPPQDALDDIYAYKGSLGYSGRPCVRYAAVLYPGSGPAEDYGGVGALPHLPQRTKALKQALQRLLRVPRS